MRVAALDLGTNTFLLLVAEVESGRIQAVLHDEVRVVRLGQGVHQNRRFHPDALSRAKECFRDFAQTIQKLGATRILACATSAARDVENAQQLIDCAAAFGIPVEIITGEREAELTFWGTAPEDLREPMLIVDVGGGSTEFILGGRFGDTLSDGSGEGRPGILSRQSVDIGSVRLTELFVSGHPISNKEQERMREYIMAQLRTIKEKFAVPTGLRVVAVAGTPTTLAAVDQGRPFESNKIDKYQLSVVRLREWVQSLSAMSVEERSRLAGMEPKRADVIVAGAMILLHSVELFGAREVEVSVRGLRYGVALGLEKML